MLLLGELTEQPGCGQVTLVLVGRGLRRVHGQLVERGQTLADLVQVPRRVFPRRGRELAHQPLKVRLGVRERRSEALGDAESFGMLATAVIPRTANLLDGALGLLEHRPSRLERLRRRVGIPRVQGRDRLAVGLYGPLHRFVGIAAVLVEPQSLGPVLGHLALEPLERRGGLLRLLEHRRDPLRAADERLASGTEGHQPRRRADRVRRDELAGPVGLGGDRGQIVLIRRDRQAEIPDHLDLGVQLRPGRGERLQLTSGGLMGLVEPIHIGGAGLGPRVDLLEDALLLDDPLGVAQRLPLEWRRDPLRQRLGAIDGVHDLEPTIPEAADGFLDLGIQGRRLSGHRRPEIRVGGGQELEPFLEGVEVIHDVGRARSDPLDPLIEAGPRAAVEHPDQPHDGRDDDQERQAESDRHVSPHRPAQRMRPDDHCEHGRSAVPRELIRPTCCWGSRTGYGRCSRIGSPRPPIRASKRSVTLLISGPWDL